jgi:uncharacterized protein (TIGR02246 family)
MFSSCLQRAGVAALACVVLALPAPAQDAAVEREEQAIRAAAKSYLAALAKGDAKGVAACWTADGEYIDEQGRAHPASEVAAEAQQSTGAGAQAEIKVTDSKIRFLTADVAVEDGASEVVWPDAPGAAPVRGHFHATWVKQGGGWRLASLCEIPEAPPPNARLAELDWMVGTWTAESDGARLEATVRWNDAGTLLLRDTQALKDGNVVLRASQRIGFDPLSGKLTSRSFDSDGGHAEAVWTKDNDSWVEQASGALGDGRLSSGTAILSYDGKDSFVRKLVAARIEGKPVPEQEVRFTRRGDSER